jgi:hypothetical protein
MLEVSAIGPTDEQLALSGAKVLTHGARWRRTSQGFRVAQRGARASGSWVPTVAAVVAALQQSAAAAPLTRRTADHTRAARQTGISTRTGVVARLVGQDIYGRFNWPDLDVTEHVEACGRRERQGEGASETGSRRIVRIHGKPAK